MIEEEVRAGGADGIAFDIIVASGERGGPSPRQSLR